jgi:hypothetical protein
LNFKVEIFSDFPILEFESFLEKNIKFQNLNKPKKKEKTFTNNVNIDQIYCRINGLKFNFSKNSEVEIYSKITKLLTKYNYFEYLDLSGKLL